MVSIPYAKHFFGSRMNGENRAQTPDSMVTVIEFVSYNCLAQTLEGCGIVSSQGLCRKEPVHQQGLSSRSLMLQHMEHLNSVITCMSRHMLKYIVHRNYINGALHCIWKRKIKIHFVSIQPSDSWEHRMDNTCKSELGIYGLGLSQIQEYCSSTKFEMTFLWHIKL